MNIFKKLFIPSGAKTTVVAYNSWVVRWNSKNRNGYEYVKQAEIFPSEVDANKFAEQLREAFKMVRYSDKFTFSHEDKLTEVVVEANQSKMATMPA